MTVTPRIRAFLPGRPRLPAPTRAGDAPKVFREFGRALSKLDRAAHTAKPGDGPKKGGRGVDGKGGGNGGGRA